jgi:hypothetical protein
VNYEMEDLAPSGSGVPGFPEHGWHETRAGYRFIWLPIRRLVAPWKWTEQPDVSVYIGRLQERHQVEAAAAHRACTRTLENLETTLRELHTLRRTFGEVGLRAGHLSSEFIKAAEMAPLFVDLALIYLRRLVDTFADSFRFIAFEHLDSAPRSFRKMKTVLTDETKRRGHRLKFDGAVLARIFSEQTVWFGLLRGDNAGREKRGYRDRLDHGRTWLSVTASQIEGKPAVLSTYLIDSQEEEIIHAEVIEGIEEILAGMCRFWTAIYRLCGSGDGYVRTSDVWLYSDGNNKEDVTGFWPRLPV